MNLGAKAVGMMPKGLLLSFVKKQFESKAKFKVDFAKIKIDYLKNKFTLILENKKLNKFISKSDEVQNYSDISDILTSKVKDKINAKEIHVVDISVFFDSKETETNIYYVDNSNVLTHQKLNDLF